MNRIAAKKEKRILFLLSMILMLIFHSPVMAADQIVTFGSDSYLVNPGETFVVDVVYGETFNGVDLNVSFNSDQLEVVEETSGVASAFINDGEGAVFMNASSVNALSAKNGNMLRITFKVKEAASGNVDLKLNIVDLFLNNDDYEAVEPEYRISDQTVRMDQIAIRSETQSSQTISTPSGKVVIEGMPEGAHVEIDDKTREEKVVQRAKEAVEQADVFKDADDAKVVAVYDINSDREIPFEKGKGTVKLPIPEDQQGYSTYYVGQEVDGKMVWNKARVEEGYVIFDTDRLGEVTIVGTDSDVVATTEADVPEIGEGNTSISPVIIGIIVAVVIAAIAGFVMIRRKKKNMDQE